MAKVAKDGRTKKELLAALALSAEACATAESAQATAERQVVEGVQEIAAQRGRIDSLDRSLSGALSRANVQMENARYLREELRLANKEYRDSELSRTAIYRQLASEVDARAQEQVLIKALTATLAAGPVHVAVEIVRRGAKVAQVSEEVALNSFDGYFRKDVIQKVEMEATAPSTLPEISGKRVMTGAEAEDILGLLDEVAGLLGVSPSL